MSREIYEALFEDTAESEDTQTQWVSVFAQAGVRWRRWMVGSLAQAEFVEGIRFDEQEAREKSDAIDAVLLAADDRETLTFPATYADGPWSVVIGLDASGEPYCSLDRGPEDAKIVGAGVSVALSPGAEVALPGLYEPPPTLIVQTEDGRRWLLVGRS